MDPAVFVHKALTAVKLSLDALNAVPASTWYLAGAIVGCGITASTVIAYINYKKRFTEAEKLAKHVIAGLLVLLSSGLSIAAFYLTNSKDFAPFFGGTAPAIYAAANFTYQIGGSKVFQKIAGILSTWANDKAQPKKSVFTTNPKLNTSAAAPDNQTTETNIFG